MVGGPGALIVTKLHKLGERFQAQDRVQQKDALERLEDRAVICQSCAVLASDLIEEVGG